MRAAPATVIVGASCAGFATAEALRDRGFSDPITLIGDETSLPYNRPPLTKQILSGRWEPEQAMIADEQRLDALGVRFLKGRRVTAVDVKNRAVWADGKPLAYTTLVAATGVAPRTAEHLPTALVVRIMADALALRERFSHGPRVAVVGAGVLGCELAATARSAGLETVLIGRGATVRLGPLNSALSHRAERLLRSEGVDVRLGVSVHSSHETPAGTSLLLSDGSELDVELVISAIGSTPVTSWLSGNGLDLSDGVLCDAMGRAAPGVYAVGDVARWQNPATGRAKRIELQSNAIEQAMTVAEQLTTGIARPVPHPFFWTELFGRRIQALGSFPDDGELRAVAGDLDAERFVATCGRDGEVDGLVGWGMARDFRLARALLPTPATSVGDDADSHRPLVDATKGRLP